MFASTAWATDYYVGKCGTPGDGTTSDCDGGADDAWNTISNITGVSAEDTVYFKKGESWAGEVLSPTSGSIGNVVTYDAYGIGDKPIIKCFLAQNKSYITAKNLEFIMTASSYGAVYIYQSDHITIEDCDLSCSSISTSYAVVNIKMDSDYNTIKGCTVTHDNLGIQNDLILLMNNAKYNLIEGNTLGTATHYALTLEGSSAALPDYSTDYNVIRDNTINNTEGAIVEIQQESNYNLFEDNTLSGGKSTSFDANSPQSLKILGEYNIVRNNIFKDNNPVSGNATGISLYTYQYTTWPVNVSYRNHIYNNVITNIDRMPIQLNTDGTEGALCHENVLKNNIFYTNDSDYQLYTANHANVHDNYFANNIFYELGVTNVLSVAGTAYSVATVESAKPTEFWDNIQSDPDLDASYIPNAGSPAIDAGVYLTEAVGAAGGGSSDELTVDDALYFWDGNGVIGSTADYIYIVGDGDPANVLVQISSITGNVITLASAQNWEDNADIYLAYSSAVGFFGTAPDVGANEYALQVYSVSITDGGTGISITASVTWNYVATVDDVEIWLDSGACDGTPDDAGADGLGDESSADADKTYDMSTLLEATAYCLTIVANDGAEQGEFQQFDFTTTIGPPPPPTGLSTCSYHSLGMTGSYAAQGSTVGQ